MAPEVSEWSVALEVTMRPESVDPERVFDLIELLDKHHPGAASFTRDGSTVGVSLYVEAPDPPRALLAGRDALVAALRNLGVRGPRLMRAEVRPWSQLEAELERRNVPELVGVAELAEILGVSKQRVSELARLEHFPRPLVELKAGPVWARESIGNFLGEWRRQPGRPAKSATASGGSKSSGGPVPPSRPERRVTPVPGRLDQQGRTPPHGGTRVRTPPPVGTRSPPAGPTRAPNGRRNGGQGVPGGRHLVAWRGWTSPKLRGG